MYLLDNDEKMVISLIFNLKSITTNDIKDSLGIDFKKTKQILENMAKKKLIIGTLLLSKKDIVWEFKEKDFYMYRNHEELLEDISRKYRKHRVSRVRIDDINKKIIIIETKDSIKELSNLEKKEFILKPIDSRFYYIESLSPITWKRLSLEKEKYRIVRKNL